MSKKDTLHIVILPKAGVVNEVHTLRLESTRLDVEPVAVPSRDYSAPALSCR